MIDILVPALQFTKALLEILNIINMMAQKHSAIACPANILAKSRTIKARGFVNIPKSSIIGINGIGNFIQVGTSGQNIFFCSCEVSDKKSACPQEECTSYITC